MSHVMRCSWCFEMVDPEGHRWECAVKECMKCEVKPARIGPFCKDCTSEAKRGRGNP